MSIVMSRPTPKPYPHYKPSHVEWLGDAPTRPYA